MTDTCDCIIVGRDVVSLVAATLLAQAGVKVFVLAGPDSPRTCGDWLLPESRSTLAKMKLFDRLTSHTTAIGNSLQLLDASGNILLSLGAEPSVRSFERVSRSVLESRLIETLHRGGARIERTGDEVDIDRPDLETWRVHCSSTALPACTYGASLVIDGRERTSTVAGWSAVTASYRNVKPATAPATAFRPLDGDGWCSLTMLGDDLVRVGAVFASPRTDGRGLAPAQMFEDRLVQCPELLNRMLAAELVDELRFTPLVRNPDPWLAFGLAGELATGQMLAGRALEALQTGQATAIDAPLRPGGCSGLTPPFSASWQMLFNPAIAEPGFFSARPGLLPSLRGAISGSEWKNSPFPPGGGEAILARV
jgi:hypothetical protein